MASKQMTWTWGNFCYWVICQWWCKKTLIVLKSILNYLNLFNLVSIQLLENKFYKKIEPLKSLKSCYYYCFEKIHMKRSQLKSQFRRIETCDWTSLTHPSLMTLSSSTSLMDTDPILIYLSRSFWILNNWIRFKMYKFK